MKTKSTFTHSALTLLALSTLTFQPSTASAQGTAFTYQGQLQSNASPANGRYDLQFILYNSSVGGSEAGPILTNAATAVSNGLLTVTLNFGEGLFTGTNYWLDIAVRTNGSGTFNELSPRQELTPTPYAIYAESTSNLLGTLPVAQLSGTVPLGQFANGRSCTFQWPDWGPHASPVAGRLPDPRHSNIETRRVHSGAVFLGALFRPVAGMERIVSRRASPTWRIRGDQGS